jgi:hypothetical protein
VSLDAPSNCNGKQQRRSVATTLATGGATLTPNTASISHAPSAVCSQHLHLVLVYRLNPFCCVPCTCSRVPV